MMTNHAVDISSMRYQNAVQLLADEKQADFDGVTQKLYNNEILFTQARYDDSVTNQWLIVGKIMLALVITTIVLFAVTDGSQAPLSARWYVWYAGLVVFGAVIYLMTRRYIGTRSKYNFNTIYFSPPAKEDATK